MRELTKDEIAAVSGADKIGAVGSCRNYPAKLEVVLDSAMTAAMIVNIWAR